jgi:DNA-binding NtrC family response regulator
MTGSVSNPWIEGKGGIVFSVTLCGKLRLHKSTNLCNTSLIRGQSGGDMAERLDCIVVDDDRDVCQSMAELIRHFYSWGDVMPFVSAEEALYYAKFHGPGVAIFVVDVFLGDQTAFDFLDSVASWYPMAHEDAVIVTGNASTDVVNMCVASNITYLIEKPIRPYSLQLSVRAIVSKYLRFARKLLEDPSLAESVLAL